MSGDAFDRAIEDLECELWRVGYGEAIGDVLRYVGANPGNVVGLIKLLKEMTDNAEFIAVEKTREFRVKVKEENNKGGAQK